MRIFQMHLVNVIICVAYMYNHSIFLRERPYRKFNTNYYRPETQWCNLWVPKLLRVRTRDLWLFKLAALITAPGHPSCVLQMDMTRFKTVALAAWDRARYLVEYPHKTESLILITERATFFENVPVRLCFINSFSGGPTLDVRIWRL